MIFPENNGIICMIDMQFYAEIPHGIDFSVEKGWGGSIELTAPGFGGKPYGNGSVLFKIGHAGKYIEQIEKECLTTAST
jgi:hypothetical protein